MFVSKSNTKGPFTVNTPIIRRDFLKSGSAVVAGSALAALGTGNLLAAEPSSASLAKVVKCSTPRAAKRGWLIGLQQYTFRRFTFFEMLDRMVTLGLQHAESAFFLDLKKDKPHWKTNESLPPEGRKELKQRLADHGITMSTFYSNLSADKDRARKIFEFCKEMGASTIVAEPPDTALDTIEPMCDEYEINLAIHNHPKSPKSKYWHPEKILAACKGRSKRIGSCSDTGHWVRSGLDPVECLKLLEGRILGFHLKDVIEIGNPRARDVPLGEGKAQYAAVLKELDRQAYRGVLTIEYEHDSPQLMDDLAKCIAFVEKTVVSLGETPAPVQ